MQRLDSRLFLAGTPHDQHEKSHVLPRDFLPLSPTRERYINLIRADKRDSFRRIAFL